MSDEVTLYRGIKKTRIISVCEECAEDQKIPIIRKPSSIQLSRADRIYSVKERLDRMSGRHNPKKPSEPIVTQHNLAKLKMPLPKQNNSNVVDDYSWVLSMARRRAKMTTSQLARKSEVASDIIKKIERGIIPENFKEIFPKIETSLGIKLIKNHQLRVDFIRKNPDYEQEILDNVRQKMKQSSGEEHNKEKNKSVEEKDLGEMTLSKLIDRKRAQEKLDIKRKQDELIGDEIDLD